MTVSVAEQVMEVVREAIIAGTLEPGELYSVDQVARDLRLDVSRTPVREALVRLADDGLVQFERNRGVRILTPSVHDLEEIFQLRLMVEVPAAYHAARYSNAVFIYKLQRELDAMAGAVRAYMDLRNAEYDAAMPDPQFASLNREFIAHDTEFHELVIGASGNQRLVETVRRWRNNIASIARWRGFDEAKDVHAEHEAILAALKIPDPSTAARAMRDHLINAGNALMPKLQEALGGDGQFDSRWFDGVAVPEEP